MRSSESTLGGLLSGPLPFPPLMNSPTTSPTSRAEPLWSTFQVTQCLPLSPEELFPFFADAANLQIITPPWLKFQILTPLPLAIGHGSVIDYRIRWRLMPMRWRTLISRWEPPCCFVDEQIQGPYRLWRHRHDFQAIPGGTGMTDTVEFAGPRWYGKAVGSVVDQRLVLPDIRRIFAYRRDVLAQRFGSLGEPPTLSLR